jgi:RimJ/RimL family protein N-acetyltransferase
MFDNIRASYFPAELDSGITAVSVDSSTFWQALDTIGQQDSPFSSLSELGNYTMPPERATRAQALSAVYAQTHREHILFTTADQACVGWSTGAMLDPSTFFMSYSAVIPRYQRHGIYSSFLRVFLRYLHALGYERVTSNHMVNNRAVLIAKLKAGFVITGTILDERWGAQAALAYFFYEDRRRGFARTYSLETYAGTPDYFS